MKDMIGKNLLVKLGTGLEGLGLLTSATATGRAIADYIRQRLAGRGMLKLS